MSSDNIVLSVSHHGKPHQLTFAHDSTLADLCTTIESMFSISTVNQKLVVPKMGLLKAPFKNPSMSLSSLAHKSVVLLGSTDAVVSSIQSAESRAIARRTARQTLVAPPVHQFRRADPYTFANILPLSWLPDPNRSLSMLRYLATDPGISYAMRKHKFSVALLTEMEPLSNTTITHAGTSRLLGLNRNQGEVIELRLRTDALDGYRDYATVRRTLCHELAHNVHSNHDAQFWELCKEIERDVDTHTRGRYLLADDDIDIGKYFAADPEAMYQDHGAWTGGEYTVGTSSLGLNEPGVTRREILARAAEARAAEAKAAEASAAADARAAEARAAAQGKARSRR